MKYTEEHVWVREDDEGVVVGITARALADLGDATFVELPEEGTALVTDDAVVVIESDGEAVEILSPLSGEVLEVNSALEDNPALVNDDPTGDGWLFTMSVDEPEQLEDLLDAKAYRALLG